MFHHESRDSDAARDVAAFCGELCRPGEGHWWAATDLDPSVDGRHIYFAGQSFEGSLEQGPANIVCRLDLADGSINRVVAGRFYRNAADGRAAYVGAGENGQERLVIVSAAGEQLCSITLDIRVEAMAWSPNGRGLLVLGADSGADVSGAEGEIGRAHV